MIRTTFWLAAALSSAPAEGGRGLLRGRTRRAESSSWWERLLDPADGALDAKLPTEVPGTVKVEDDSDFTLSAVDPTSVTMPTPGIIDDGTTAGRLVPRWHPVNLSGHRTCVYDADYDPAYLTTLATFLFDEREECCKAFQACQTSHPTSSPTVRPKKWFPHTFDDGRHGCAHGTFYPDEMAKAPFSATFLHDTEEACCEGFPAACRQDDIKRWIPNQVGDDCAHVELPPNLLRENHSWVFNTREECCESHPCIDVGSSSPPVTEAPATTDPTELTTESAETTTMIATTESPETTPGATTTANSGAHCEMGYDPVCGHDGLAYGSGCDAVAFGSGVACELDAGSDIVAGSPCSCPDSGCEMGYDPVCGHDGLAYGSGCDAVEYGSGIACELDAGLDVLAGSPCSCPDSPDATTEVPQTTTTTTTVSYDGALMLTL